MSTGTKNTELNRYAHDLAERVKELNCLYRLADIDKNTEASIEEIFQAAAELIPPAWQYPDIACARLTLEGREFKAGNFEETGWSLSAEIEVYGETAGAVEVFYLEERTEAHEGPFLKEERSLIDAIADRLGWVVERIGAEEALRESMEEYQDLYENAPDMFASVDVATARVLLCNRTLARTLGYTREEIVGRQVYDLYHPDCLHRVKDEIFKEVRATGEVRGEDLRLVRKDGSEIDVSLNVSAVRDEEGNIVESRSIWRDISDVKQAEREKEALHAQLLQSQKMEAIGHLAGGVAHDFNNILAIILGCAQVAALDLERKEGVLEELKTIVDTVKRAKDLTMKMLALARKERPNVRAVSLNDLVEDTGAMLKRSISKKIRIETVLQQGLPPARINANQIQQALLNVCNNAADAMPDGGKLRIGTGEAELNEAFCRLHEWLVPGRFCLVRISDTGMGIPGNMLEKVFDPFYTTKAAGKGTGLGLSVTHGIIRNHGGHICITSEPGEGTAVEIMLPAAEEASGMSEDAGVEESAGGTETVLIVDDEKVILNSLGKLLRVKGYEVITALGGREAVDIYTERGGEIDLVLLDLIMPEMDGRDVLRAIQELDPDVKVILVTGYVAGNDVEKLMSEGVRGLLRKPYELEQLLVEIHRVVDE